MKSLIISLILLLIVICLIITNSIYLNHLTSNMLELVESLPDESSLDKLINLWECSNKIVGLSVNYDYIYTITSTLISTQRFREGGSSCEYEYRAARDMLYEAIMRLHKLEQFSIDNFI